MKALLLSILLGVIVYAGNASAADLIRAADMTPAMWSEFGQGKLKDTILEFRDGDLLPLNFVAQGDVLESENSVATSLRIKKSFWLKVNGAAVMMSFDGQAYKPFQQAVSGSLSVGADKNSGNDVANGINVQLEMNQRK